MTVTLYASQSLNGYIARTTGEEDFISVEAWDTVVHLGREVGAIIMGRGAFEAVQGWDDHSFAEFGDIPKVVVSHQDIHLPPGFIAATSPEDALFHLHNEGKEKALLIGGGIINAAFLQKRLVEEVYLRFDPVFVTAGRPVADGLFPDIELRLNKVEQQPEGGLLLHLVRA